jgi:pilus assembly protein TadC
MSIADLSMAGVNMAGVNIVVMSLTVAAILVWPGAYSASASALGRSAGGQDRVGARANADAGVIRTVVAVAEVAGVIDLLAMTLRGGVGLVEAMEAVAVRVGGPLGLHLKTVAAAGRWGVEDATAWASVPSAWQPAARALRMAASAGVPPADALAGAADEVRRTERQRLEVATATLGIRIVLPLGLVFLPAFILTTVMPIVLALAQQVLASQ